MGKFYTKQQHDYIKKWYLIDGLTADQIAKRTGRTRLAIMVYISKNKWGKKNFNKQYLCDKRDKYCICVHSELHRHLDGSCEIERCNQGKSPVKCTEVTKK